MYKSLPNSNTKTFHKTRNVAKVAKFSHIWSHCEGVTFYEEPLLNFYKLLLLFEREEKRSHNEKEKIFRRH